MEAQMVKQSPHTSWKGCALCKPGKHKGAKTLDKVPWPVLKKLGIKRRYNRNKMYGED